MTRLLGAAIDQAIDGHCLRARFFSCWTLLYHGYHVGCGLTRFDEGVENETFLCHSFGVVVVALFRGLTSPVDLYNRKTGPRAGTKWKVAMIEGGTGRETGKRTYLMHRGVNVEKSDSRQGEDIIKITQS